MGLVLLLVGLFVGLFFSWTIGFILMVVGLILVIAAAAGQSRYW